MKSREMINVVNGLYERIVKYNESFSRNEGICFCIKVDAECYGYEKDGNTHHEEWEGRDIKYMYIMILRGNQVFTNISSDFSSSIPTLGWKNTSNHDSCWRGGSDELVGLCFDCWDEAFYNCPKKARPSTKNEGLRVALGFGLIEQPFKLVEVTKEPDLSIDDTGYHKKILSVKEIHKTIVI